MGRGSFAGTRGRSRRAPPLGLISPQTDPAFEIQGQRLPSPDWGQPEFVSLVPQFPEDRFSQSLRMMQNPQTNISRGAVSIAERLPLTLLVGGRNDIGHNLDRVFHRADPIGSTLDQGRRNDFRDRLAKAGYPDRLLGFTDLFQEG